MKKIVFSDRCGMMSKVLRKKKVVTRRLIECPKEINGVEVRGFFVWRNDSTGEWSTSLYGADGKEIGDASLVPPFVYGDIVALAQTYNEIWPNLCVEEIDMGKYQMPDGSWVDFDKAGVDDRRFVRAELMPRKVLILEVRPERLQEITDVDCVSEGITALIDQYGHSNVAYIPDEKTGDFGEAFPTVRAAYAEMADRLMGRGTWEENPWVWRIEFGLIPEGICLED